MSEQIAATSRSENEMVLERDILFIVRMNWAYAMRGWRQKHSRANVEPLQEDARPIKMTRGAGVSG